MQILTAALLLTRQGRHLPGTWQRGREQPPAACGREARGQDLRGLSCLPPGAALPHTPSAALWRGEVGNVARRRREKAPEWLYLEALAVEVSLGAVPQATHP